MSTMRIWCFSKMVGTRIHPTSEGVASVCEQVRHPALRQETNGGEMTIEQFCDTHNACGEGREWALSNCSTMAEAWDKCENPSWLIWIATRSGVFDDRTLRLFACWCARQVWHLLTDERSRNAVVVAERYADGKATSEELSAAESAAESAAWSAAESAAESAARSAARSAAESAAWSAAESAQAEYLRKLGNPFEVKK